MYNPLHRPRSIFPRLSPAPSPPNAALDRQVVPDSPRQKQDRTDSYVSIKHSSKYSIKDSRISTRCLPISLSRYNTLKTLQMESGQ